MGIVRRIDRIDKKASGVFHRATSSLIALVLLPSGTIHNAYQGAIVLMLALIFYIVD